MENKIYLVGTDKKRLDKMCYYKEAALLGLAVDGETKAVVAEWRKPNLDFLKINNVVCELSNEEKEELLESIEEGFYSWLFKNPKYMRYIGLTHNITTHDLTVYKEYIKLKGKVEKQNGLE